MEHIINEHNSIPRCGIMPLVKLSDDDNKVQLHKINLIGKKINGEETNINLSINAYYLNYGPCIYYNILTNIPYYKDTWIDHPYKNINLDYDSYNIMIGDYIDNTLSTQKIIEDIILENNWKQYSKKLNEIPVIKSKLINSSINIKCFKMHNDKQYNIKLCISVLELENNCLAIKITTDIPMKTNEIWSSHPFRHIKMYNKTVISGYLNDTLTIRQMINDLININEFELYTTTDSDYRSHIIANLYTLFVKPNDNDKTQSQVIQTLIKCLKYHWS